MIAYLSYDQRGHHGAIKADIPGYLIVEAAL
jgi:hypothetical protein